MKDDFQSTLTMISEELYATDWAGRFDTFETFHSASRVSVDRILDRLEVLAKSNLHSITVPSKSDALLAKLQEYEPNTPEWHWLSVIVKVASIRMAMQRDLGHSAALGAIHLMHSLFGVLDKQAVHEQSDVAQQKAPVKAFKKVREETVTDSHEQPHQSATQTTRHLRAVASQSVAAKANLSGNVVLKQLVPEEPEGVPLAQQCRAVADELAEKYPEYTLTAIRVLTAEKMGVSRQYLENLDVTPKKFRK